MRNETVQLADPAGFFESILPLVEAVVKEVARRHRVRGDALDEFRSLVFLKLVEHDYAVLRRFEGASSLRTYLTVVLQRVLLDHRNREWGRWRASAAASRIGPVAVRLERLVTRDGLTPGEAIAALSPHTDVSGCADFVSTLGRRCAVRGSRATLGQNAIPECLDPGPDPEARMDRREQAARADTVRVAVRDALRALRSQDHLAITLRYRDGLSIADVARVLEVDAKPLYRRIERVLGHLREMLCTDELQGELARELARNSGSDVVPAGESEWWRPSIQVSESDSSITHVQRRTLSRRRPARRVHRQLGAESEHRSRTASL